MIYLDNNATTLMIPEVADAIDRCCRERLANPASSHASGRQARRRLEHSRESIVSLLGGRDSGMQSDRLLLTSGGTESNNLALLGLAAAREGQIIVSGLEHPSIAAAADRLAAEGRTVVRLGADADGVTRLDQLPELLRQPTAVVSVMWANNETGVLQPIPEIATLCREAGAPFHSDAVQAVGKTPLSFRAIEGLTAITFNAHKIHGPRGVGGLLIVDDAQPEPQMVGGFQQLGLRPGTESTELAVGMETAIRIAIENMAARTETMRALQNQLESNLRQRVEGCVIIGANADRLPHTSCVSFPGVDRQAMLMQLDQGGLACSTGSACASGSSEPSPVLQAMGLPEETIEGALRFSLSFQTTEAEIDAALDRIEAAWRQVHG